MTEGLFILTTIFVAYVVYVIIGEQKTTTKSKASAIKPEVRAAAEQPKPIATVAKENPVSAKTVTPKTEASIIAAPKENVKPAVTKSTSVKPATTKKTATSAVKSAGLKDPKTGDIATTYSNYRFTKRWIKEALVTEGFLEKVYTNNELNAETDAKIKEAIGKLEAIDTYKV